MFTIQTHKINKNSNVLQTPEEHTYSEISVNTLVSQATWYSDAGSHIVQKLNRIPDSPDFNY